MENKNWKKDTIKEWTDVFDLDFKGQKQLETLFDIVIKKSRKEEREKIIAEIKEMPTYTDVDLGFKNYVIEELENN
jgi:hypothetical protein